MQVLFNGRLDKKKKKKKKKKRKRSSVGESNPHYCNSPVPVARASTTCAIEDSTSISVIFLKKKLVSDERVASHAGVFRGARLWGGMKNELP